MPNAYFGEKINDKIILNEKEIQHLNITRTSIGETIDVFLGNGYIYNCKIKTLKKKQCNLEIIDYKIIKDNYNPDISLTIGMSKWERMQIVIEKAVELRVNAINIFQGEKSQHNYKNIDKIKKCVIESAKQSYNPNFPEVNFTKINEINPFKTIVLDFEVNSDYKTEIKRITENVNILIGPDTGFSEKEKLLLKEKRFKIYFYEEKLKKFPSRTLSFIFIYRYLVFRLYSWIKLGVAS